MFGKKSLSKAELLSDPDPVDCSWCAVEQGAPCTNSPTICDYHATQIEQQSAARHAAKHDTYVGHQRGHLPSKEETLADYVGRKLRGR